MVIPTKVTPLNYDIDAGYISDTLNLGQEVWKVGYKNASVQVFNRWGEMVFQADPYGNDWEGLTNLGRGTLASGTYLYNVNPKDGTENKTGYLEIIQPYLDDILDTKKSSTDTNGFSVSESNADFDGDGIKDDEDACPNE